MFQTWHMYSYLQSTEQSWSSQLKIKEIYFDLLTSQFSADIPQFPPFSSSQTHWRRSWTQSPLRIPGSQRLCTNSPRLRPGFPDHPHPPFWIHCHLSQETGCLGLSHRQGFHSALWGILLWSLPYLRRRLWMAWI